MQIPIMAIDVFMGRFIASAAFSVKAESAGREPRPWRESISRAGFRKVPPALTKWPRKGRKAAQIRSQCEARCRATQHANERGKTMDIRTHETTRIRAEYAQLTRHYRAIGPAAILAALLFRRPAHNALPSR